MELKWQLIEGIEEINARNIPFVRIIKVDSSRHKVGKDYFGNKSQRSIAFIKNEKNKPIVLAYYQLDDFSGNTPYRNYAGTNATRQHRPMEAIDTRIILGQPIPDPYLSTSDYEKLARIIEGY